MGFGKGSAGVGGEFFQLLILIFMELFGVSLGQFIGAISPSMQIAPIFNAFLLFLLGTFCGVTIPYPSMPSYWKWIYELTPYTRTLSALVSTELTYVSSSVRDRVVCANACPPLQRSGRPMQT